MRLRDFTQDYIAFQEVYLENEYEVPRALSASDVVLDIGAQVGCFAIACVGAGAGRVVCYEPDPESFALLQENMAPYSSVVECHRLAVWRSDKQEPVRVHADPNPRMTACTQVASESLGKGGRPCQAVALDDVLRALGRVTIMKLDCEGAEYPILYTSRELARCEQIVGEAHEKIPWAESTRPCTGASVAAYLGVLGFDARFVPHARAPEHLSHFFAKRRTT